MEKNNYKTIKQTIEYKWFSAKDFPPQDGNLNWVVLTNKENELEITICDYNIFFNRWEVLEGEEVLFWMPFDNFMPQLIF